MLQDVNPLETYAVRANLQLASEIQRQRKVAKSPSDPKKPNKSYDLCYFMALQQAKAAIWQSKRKQGSERKQLL